MIRSFLLTLCLAAIAHPTFAASPASVVLDGSATLTRSGRLYRAERGTKLFAGDILNVQDRLQFLLPYGAATVSKRRGLLKFVLQQQEGCGIRVQISYSGGIGANARPKSCPTSSISFESLTTGAFFNPWVSRRSGRLIPNTLIAQALSFTGANFDLVDRGHTSVLSVQSGAVEAMSANVIVPISGGMGNLTERDKPPGEPIPLDENLSVNRLRIVRVPTGVKILAGVSPLNTIEVQGRAYRLGDTIPFPITSNSLRVTIRDTSGDRTRTYTYPLPLRKT